MNKPTVLHDLKSDRQDLTPPLPAVLRLLPLFFYLALAGAGVLGAHFYLETRKAKDLTALHESNEKEQAAMLEKLRGEQGALDAEFAKAKEVEQWVDSSRPLMTIITSVVNSVKQGNTLSSLKLARSAENPEHVDMTLLINSGGNSQVEETRNALSKEGYQAFKEDTTSTDRNNRLGDVTYSAVFVNTGGNH